MDYRKLLSAGVAAFALMMGIAAADFTRSNTYTEGQFTDVPSNEWYASSVKDAYEFGIMNGDSATTFNPDGTLTVAEGITITSRLHATANGKTIPDASGEWYQKYVDYAIANGLMEEGQFDGYDINIKRFEIAELFAAASADLPKVNSVSTLPDVASGVSYADDVLKLYNAGILGGNDSYGTFAPNSYLLRSEISAMSVRIADSTKRVKKDFEEIPARAFTDSYYIVENPMESTGSWDYDNRFDLLNFDGSKSSVLSDTSDEQFFALNRDFKAEYEGILRLEIAGTFRSGDNGAYIALQNEQEDRIIEITAKNGEWVLNGENSVSTGVSVSDEINSFYTFVLEIDLDKNTAFAVVNNRQSETVKIKPDESLVRLVLGTNKVGKGYIKKEHVRMSKNYVLDENFLAGEAQSGEKAASWDITGDFAITGMPGSVLGKDIYSLKADSAAGTVSTAKKSYEPISGKVVMEAYVLFPEKVDGASVAFTSAGNEVFKFETNDGKIVMGENELHDYIPNVWQWLYVEADTSSGKAIVKINGKKKAEVTFDAKVLDGIEICFAPASDGVMWVDDLEVYPLIEHADYPSYPQVAESTDYNIGLNMCYLWRDTQSGEGWDAVSGFSEFDTYLGFYDEGLRETADRELKLMAEHGIDFIHVCWYTPSYNTYNQNAPIKKMRFSYSALHDGYMNAKYSDLVDFCIMWENSWGDVSSLDQFKAYIWPYWKEHYFSDERYVRLDNKALITVWSHTTMMNSLGGTVTALNEAIDFMNEDIKSLGYDGIILLSQTQSANTASHYENLEGMGFDGTYAYHYGVNGYSAEHQINCNETNAANSTENCGNIPTISNGFNNVGRGDTRHPVITGEDHLKVAENIKKILSESNTGSWRDNTLMISTWNEYSEGTYAMPTRGTGFDYLENIRKVFTNDTSDHTEADKPLTKTQLERIGHMYAPGRSVLRRLHLEKSEAESFVVTPDMLEPVRTYDMSKDGAQYWEHEFGITDYSEENGVISGEGKSSDYGFRSIGTKFAVLNAEDAPYLHIRMKTDVAKSFEVFFMTGAALNWNHSRRVESNHEAAGEFVDYYIDMSSNSSWTGEITGIRIDPLMAPGKFEVSLIEFMNFIPTEDTTPRVYVNGTELEFAFNPVLTSDGDVAVVAEPGKGFFSSLRLFHTWDRFTGDGVLTVKSRDGKTLVFKVGSDKVTFDGVQKDLGYTLTLRDGLPVLHLKKLCDMLGYRIISGYNTEILSCSDEEYAKITARKENSWEFDFAADLDGFVTQLGAIDIDGESKLVFVPTGADVAVMKLLNFKADAYNTITMGVEYSEAFEDATPQLFFTTGSDPSWGWTAEKCINGTYSLEGKKYGDIIEVTFNLEDNPAFSGTITGLRFDPIGKKEVFKIDYIRCLNIEKDIYDGLTEAESLSWTFDGDGDLAGWQGQSCSLSASDGCLNGECSGADIAIINTGVSFNCADAQVVVVGVKYNPDFCDGEAELFFVTDKSTQYSADKCVRASYRVPEMVLDGETVEVIFDLTANSYFKSNIKGLRIDLHDGKYPFSVDYIKLYKKDGYMPPEENTVVNKPTMPTSAVIPDVEKLPDGVKVAAGGAGKLEIVSNPENESEKVYKIACVVPGNYYTYLYVHMNFEAGKRYNISYKLYPLKTMNGDDYTTAIAGNVMYGSDGENVVNHILDAEHTKASGAGWIDVNTSIVIDTDYNPTESDHFEIWGRPVDGVGVEYLVKDLSIVPA